MNITLPETLVKKMEKATTNKSAFIARAISDRLAALKKEDVRQQLLTVVPFSSRSGPVQRHEVAVPAGAFGDGRLSRLKTHQLRAVDKSRVGNKFGVFPDALMPALERSIRRHLGV